MSRDEPVRYVCSGCGHRTTTRTGRCPSCGAWGTLEAESGLARLAEVRRRRMQPFGYRLRISFSPARGGCCNAKKAKRVKRRKDTVRRPEEGEMAEDGNGARK